MAATLALREYSCVCPALALALPLAFALALPLALALAWPGLACPAYAFIHNDMNYDMNNDMKHDTSNDMNNDMHNVGRKCLDHCACFALVMPLPCPALPFSYLGVLILCEKQNEHQGNQLTIVPLIQKRHLRNTINTLVTNFVYTVQESHAWTADTVETFHSFIHLMVSYLQPK